MHRRQKQLQEREPEVHNANFISLYRRLLDAVLRPDPGANAGPGAQLRTSMEHLHLNHLKEEEEEEEEEEDEEDKSDVAKGLDQGSERPLVSVAEGWRVPRVEGRGFRNLKKINWRAGHWSSAVFGHPGFRGKVYTHQMN